MIVMTFTERRWYWKGLDDGVTTWLPRPDIFPDGIYPLYNKTGWPVVGHNRFWAADTPYAKQNGGLYDFIIERQHNKSMPTSQKFWDDLVRDFTILHRMYCPEARGYQLTASSELGRTRADADLPRLGFAHL